MAQRLTRQTPGQKAWARDVAVSLWVKHLALKNAALSTQDYKWVEANCR